MKRAVRETIPVEPVLSVAIVRHDERPFRERCKQTVLRATRPPEDVRRTAEHFHHERDLTLTDNDAGDFVSEVARLTLKVQLTTAPVCPRLLVARALSVWLPRPEVETAAFGSPELTHGCPSSDVSTYLGPEYASTPLTWTVAPSV